MIVTLLFVCLIFILLLRNVNVTQGSGKTIAFDDIGGVEHQRVIPAVSIPISVTPTITAGAYADGDNLGGLQTLTSAARTTGGLAILESIVITDKANQQAEMTILFFDSDPTGAGTDLDNNDPFAITTALSKVIGHVDIVVGNYTEVDSKAVATLPGINLGLPASGSANLYAAAIVRGAPTFASTTDLTFKYIFSRG